ncbi:hypothetical protein [Bradyrhizobium genosp. A]|uniref:hypothetical protein n=1 Tax=Bradyrhizobium genosp. A TaxID=83626 RepID=UPI003CEC8BA0
MNKDVRLEFAWCRGGRQKYGSKGKQSQRQYPGKQPYSSLPMRGITLYVAYPIAVFSATFQDNKCNSEKMIKGRGVCKQIYEGTRPLMWTLWPELELKIG